MTVYLLRRLATPLEQKYGAGHFITSEAPYIGVSLKRAKWHGMWWEVLGVRGRN